MADAAKTLRTGQYAPSGSGNNDISLNLMAVTPERGNETKKPAHGGLLG